MIVVQFNLDTNLQYLSCQVNIIKIKVKYNKLNIIKKKQKYNIYI